MNTSMVKTVGFACLAIGLIALFVAIERYQANASEVEAFNQMPMARLLTGGEEIQPATPTITKYALLVAILSLGGGGICLYLVYGQAHFEEDDEPAAQSPTAPDQAGTP